MRRATKNRLFDFSRLFLCFAIVSAALLGQAKWIQRECHGESRLLFLDDLFSFGQGEARDPFEERIETERHDFTQSAKTVGRHVAQIESGYSYFYNDTGHEVEQIHTTPEMMLRFGLSEDIEFRLRWTYAWEFIDEGHNLNSAEDLRWGFKLAVTEQECWIPQSAVELRFTAPTGGSAYSTTKVEAGFDYIYDWKIAENWRIYGSTGFGTQALGDFGLVPEEPAADRFTAWSQSVALETELTERVTLYNEFYGIFSYGLEEEYEIVIYNLGVDYYVTDDVVLDFRIGLGLTDDSDDLFTGVGGGFRF